MASTGSGGKESISLNLYPMMDIFSILIIFLLMSYSSDPVNHDVNPAITLPRSQTFVSLDEVPTVVVTPTELFVNDKKIGNIVGGDAEERDRDQGAIRPLFDELQKLREAGKRLEAQTPAAQQKTGTLTLEIDQNHRFQLMKRIMLSGQQAEFITYKMMVEKGGQ